MGSKKQVVTTIIAYALGLLSIAAGIPKIMQMPQELGFLSSIGFSGIAVSILGVVQLLGGAMLFWSRTRLAGALLAGLAMLVSSVAIFAGGDATFGMISLLPFVVALVIAYMEARKLRQNAR